MTNIVLNILYVLMFAWFMSTGIKECLKQNYFVACVNIGIAIYEASLIFKQALFS